MGASRPSPGRLGRRTSTAVLALAIATLAFPARPPAAGPHPPIEPLPAAPALAPGTHEPPAAYLAWTPGGLPPGFREEVGSLPRVERAAVFAGDTIWLTRTADRTGRTIDDPRPPYAVPIDAFAVSPRDIAPFLHPDPRRAVVDALARGRAVLGARSAALRRLGVGGTLEFGAETVAVGAIVPEELLGWSEVLVSRETGARLGIRHDRHAWIRLEGDPALPAAVALVRRLVPTGEPVRVERPGGTPFLRAANGVNPPIVLKRAFGEFAAAVDPAVPWSFHIAPAWTEANLVTRRVPLLGTLTCHRAFMVDLLAAIREVRRRGLGPTIRSTAGCFNPRTVARSPTNPPSFHAYGAAVDINAPENPFGATPTMDPRVVAIFERRGFNWGGGFLIPDGMHFEYGGGPLTGT